MAALYTVTNDHPLASEKVMAMTDEDVFGAQLLTAEVLLGLKSPALTESADVDKVHLALMHQINFQVQQGLDPLIQSSAGSQHSGDNAAWRDRYINPVAASILAEVLPEAGVDPWNTRGMVSHRTGNRASGYPRREYYYNVRPY